MLSAETDRLTAMVERLLEWASMEAGRRVYKPMRVPAGQVVRRRARGARLADQDAAASRRITKLTRRAAPTTLPLVEVDVDAMTEALLNVLQNALRYTGDDKEIAVRAVVRDKARWSSPSPTTGRASPSTSSARSSRSSIASSIRPTRRRGHGAGPGDRAPHRARAPRARFRRERRGQGRRVPHPACRRRCLCGGGLMAETILIVEDDPSILRGLQMNLGLEGFRLIAAHDGDEALRVARARTSRDLIVLDLMLPKLGGLDVIRALRADDPDTPILVLSAKDQEGDKVLALSLGADDYVTKPFGARRADRAHSRGAARQRRRQGRAASGDRASATSRSTSKGGACWSTAKRSSRPRASSICCASSMRTRAWSSRASSSCSRCGGRTTSAPSAPSTTSSPGCAPRSKTTPTTPRHIETVRGVGYRFNP